MSISSESGFHVPSRFTERMLIAGVISAPMFIVIFLGEVLFRQGYHATTIPLSLLALGDAGWIQIANFTFTGIFSLLGSIGLALSSYRFTRKTFWGPRIFGLYSIALILAGAFQTDASYGFPVGTPPGPPSASTVHGIVHWAAFAVIMLSLTAAAILWSRYFHLESQRSLSLYSAAVGILVPCLIVFAFSTGAIIGITAATFIGYSFLSVVCIRVGKPVDVLSV